MVVVLLLLLYILCVWQRLARNSRAEHFSMDQLLIAVSRSLQLSSVLSAAVDYVTSVLWVSVTLSCCWISLQSFMLLVGRQDGHPACKKLSGGVLAWLSVWNAVQTCIWPSWCHCHSLSLASVKSRLVLPFWYWLTRVVPDEGPLNGCVCVFHRGKCRLVTAVIYKSTTSVIMCFLIWRLAGDVAKDFTYIHFYSLFG